MVSAQGGPSRLLSDPDSYLPSAAHIAPVFADRAGFITRIDARAIGLAVVQMGGGRRRAADAVDPSVGLDCLVRPGQETKPGSPLAVVHAADDGAWQRAAATVRSAVAIGPEPPASLAAVLTRVLGGRENDS